MAVAKVIYDGVTKMDLTSNTVASSNLVSGYSATGADGESVAGAIDAKTDSDVVISGSTVTVDAGYYPSTVTKEIATVTHPNPTISIDSSGLVTASHTQNAGYVVGGTTSATNQLTTLGATTYTPTTSNQTISAGTLLTGDQTIAGDPNLIPENIAYGVSVFGVNGSLDVSSPPEFALQKKKVYPATENYIENADNDIFYLVAAFYAHDGDLNFGDGSSYYTNPAYGQMYGSPSNIGDIKVGDRVFISGSLYLVNSSGYEDDLCHVFTYTGTNYTYSTRKYTVTISPSGSLGSTTGTGNAYIRLKSTGSSSIESSAAEVIAIYHTIGYEAISEVEVVGTNSFDMVGDCLEGSITEYIDYSATNVRSGLFSLCIDMSRVYAPSCTTIGNEAFEYCYKLQDVFLPEVLSIGNMAFLGCKVLHDVDLPKCESIAGRAFAGCKYLNQINIPSCTSLGYGAFSECQLLKSINLQNIQVVESLMFYNDYNLSSVSLPMCSIISQSAFAYCYSLNTLYAPSCKEVYSYAFINCNGLKSLSLPACRTIMGSAFQGCRISSLYLPNCQWVGPGAFSNSISSMSSIDMPKLSFINTYAFMSCPFTNVSLSLVSYIGSSAFCSCRSLSFISFPICSFLGSGAFQNCVSLSQAFFPEVSSVGYSTFAYCRGLKEISFPKLISITSSMFAFCSALSIIPLSAFPIAQTIQYCAFVSCSALSAAYFKSVNYIMGQAFIRCFNLISLYILNDTVASLVSTAFNSTPIGGYSASAGVFGSIFVPSSLYNSYIVAPSWSFFSSRIVSLTDSQIAALLQ